MSIEISNINFKFKPKDDFLFQKLSLTLESNQLTFLIGASGVGKSTLAQILSGLVKTKGLKYQLDAANYSWWTHNRFMKQVGYVFQNPDYQLLGLKVIDEFFYNVPKSMRDQIHSNLEKYLLHLNFDKSLLERPSFSLSYGEKRKLLIIKFLLSNRKFIILDEPSSNLDYASRHELMKLLSSLSKQTDRYFLIISHDIDLTYQYADCVFLLEKQQATSVLKKIDKHLFLTNDYFGGDQWQTYFGKILQQSKQLNSFSDLQSFFAEYSVNEGDKNA